MSLTVTAQGIVVNKKDGTKVYYKASEVQSVGVYGYGEGPTDDPDTHDYVDLGLPSGTLWATCNVGATKPEEYGDYFAWGETAGFNGGKTAFNWKTYKYSNGSGTTMIKYCLSNSYGVVDNRMELEPADDAATANWGSKWQMPSDAQCAELINEKYTKTTWTTLNGVSGSMIVSKSNGKWIFLPAAGYRYDESLCNAGSNSHYWSRSLYSGNSNNGFNLYFVSSCIHTLNNLRNYGQSVRPVVRK